MLLLRGVSYAFLQNPSMHLHVYYVLFRQIVEVTFCINPVFKRSYLDNLATFRLQYDQLPSLLILYVQ